MDAKRIGERDLVQLCMVELCKQAGLADAGRTVQRDLEFLCDKIESKTGVLISVSTMRRLLNGQFSRQPQVATLNAIAQYLGYQSWQDFKLEKTAGVTGQAKSFQANEPTLFPFKRFSFTRYPVFIVILMLTALGLFAMLKLGKPGVAHFEKATFSLSRATRTDLPNTVIFKYNVDEVNADSFFIQQSWDWRRKVRIYKNTYTLTDIYYEPGFHTAKLIANDQVIKTLDVSIPTDRWFFYAKEKVPLSQPKYIHSVTGIENGSLLLNMNEILASQVDISKNNEYHQEYFPSAIQYDSDNFRFTCRVRVNQLNNNFCPSLMCEVFCQKHFMFFEARPKGCASEIRANYGEKFIDGKTNDLSALGIDLKDWQNIELTVQNKNVIILVNDKKVFACSYQQQSGMITGLGFISNGLCEIDNVDFQTLDGKIIYKNDFEK
jgi:hypothetical protein